MLLLPWPPPPPLRLLLLILLLLLLLSMLLWLLPRLERVFPLPLNSAAGRIR
jgi:hypothetical protein